MDHRPREIFTDEAGPHHGARRGYAKSQQSDWTVAFRRIGIIVQACPNFGRCSHWAIPPCNGNKMFIALVALATIYAVAAALPESSLPQPAAGNVPYNVKISAELQPPQI